MKKNLYPSSSYRLLALYAYHALLAAVLICAVSVSVVAQNLPTWNMIATNQTRVLPSHSPASSGSVLDKVSSNHYPGMVFAKADTRSSSYDNQDNTRASSYTPGYEVFDLMVTSRKLQEQSSTELVSNVNAATGKSYTLSLLEVGVNHYTDRTFQVTSVPTSLSSVTMIRTANDDKTNNSSSLLSFNLSQEATVYVAYDPRATALPTWLSGWQKLSDRVGVNDSKISYMNLYSKSFPAGTVTLGGNMQSPAAGAQNNYFVIAKAVEAGKYILSVSTTGSGWVSKNPDQTSYASGTSVSLTATAASGYKFSGWSGDASGTANPLSLTMDSNKSITANFTQTESSTGLVSNVSVTSGRSYIVADLAVGVYHYTDRTFQVTSVPTSLSSVTMIRTANDDKTNNSSSLLSFNLSQEATVYVAYDPRATALPTWLSGWQKLSDRVGVNDSKISYMNLYSKSFPAGTVTLGGNMQSPAAGAQNNYFVIAKGSTSTTNQAPVANAGPDKTITLPTDYVSLDGSGADADGTISGYSWRQVNGPGAATFSSTTVAKPTVSKLLAGNYVFGLVVRDDQNIASAEDQVTVTVQSATTSSGCPPYSTIPCDQLQVALPFNLSFGGPVAGTVADKNGAGTGFTMVDAYSGVRNSGDGTPSNSNLPGYEASKLTIASGRLQVVTNKGIAYINNNNQINALGVRVDSRSMLALEVKLVNPYYGTSSQQGGLWMGLNDRTFVKLVVVGNKVELRREINDGSSTSDQRTTSSISGINNALVRLRLEVDPAASMVSGFYSLNGGTEQSVGTALSISGMGLTTSTAYAGIYATHRNGTSPVTYTFDDFAVATLMPTDSLNPYVTAVRPENGATGVHLDQSVSVDLAFPSGASLDGSTVNPGTVKLYKIASGTKTEVTGTAVNSTAAGDAITLTATLALSTKYEFVISDKVKDLNGHAMLPFTSSFTTTSTAEKLPADLEGVSFTEQILIDRNFGSDGFTSLAIGPDRRLYATTSGGKIERWDIRSDGTLANHFSISPFGSSRRLIVGFRFDPAATKNDLLVWVSHSAPEFLDAPDWSSKVSKINLNNPSSPQVVDYVINLPRSIKDHSVFSIDFGPDGAMYFMQGGNSAMGAPDPSWGDRPERLLSAAVLRLDIKMAEQQTLPIDAKTEEGGNYNPYATNAPLTLYATGLRNAYDLVWHTNGQLYVPTNGSAAGGSTPALKSGTVWSNGSVYTGPDIPGMTNVRATQSDYLFRVVKGGYYGHPNVLRNEYIMNGGNPTSGVDPGEVVWTADEQAYGYPVGTPTEPNYRGWSYDFGLNKSPNGVIEYKSNAFGGRLTGKLLVCRFSGGDDLMLLEPGGTKMDIVRAIEGSLIPGLRRPYSNPLDVIEDVLTGNLYLSEYFDGNGDGQPRITLLRPSQPAIATRVNAGGPQYKDSKSLTWGADTYAKGGTNGSKSFDVQNTTDDELYLKYRFALSGAPFSYSLPVSGSGPYTVKLHFVEPYYGAPGGKTTSLAGARVFNVDVEGQRVLSNYDIYSQDGAGKAVVKTFNNVTVVDGMLDVVLSSVKDNAIISALEVVEGTVATAVGIFPDVAEDDSKLKVYPNPSNKGKVFIELNDVGDSEPVNITLQDMAGRVLLSTTVVTDEQGAASATLDFDKTIQRGLYIIKAQSSSAVWSQKLIVE
ncbi:malectin domain-containing carbohydrate-binding protein [Pontibacter pamirensis]|uniref:malectin domain-containing carbohydrate-binding protein n=1 Tax=Pontibacter pamirensis TaxID=2562824 RepID=UPI00138995A2|nr:malectin domain-containing carbohydrate-binding protein [Pontibacter pamirensis]